MTGLKRRVATATLVATGHTGPLETALNRMQRYGLGARVVKSALAAGLAWEIAQLIHRDPIPVLAPITAIFTIQLTLARSVLGSVQRILGVVLGILVALGIAEIGGRNGWTIGLVVLIAIAGGLRLGLEPSGVEQMTVSALLVLLAGSAGQPAKFAGWHLLDTLIGTAAGLTLNWLIAAPSFVPGARDAVRAAGAELGATLDEIAAQLAVGLTAEGAATSLAMARATTVMVGKTNAALAQADDSLTYNVPGRRQRSELHRYERTSRALEHASIQTRIVARTLSDAIEETAPTSIRPAWLDTAALGMPLADLISAIEQLLQQVLALSGDVTLAKATNDAAHEALTRHREARLAATAWLPRLPEREWALLGELISVTDQLLIDLQSAANELTG